MKSPLRRLLPGIIVSVAFTWWFLSDAHWGEIGGALRGMRYEWLAASAAVLYSEFYIRALRWKVLLRPLAPQARIERLFVATVIGMGLNVILPLRAGDLARPWLGWRETGVSIPALITIAVIERVFDLVGLVCVFVLMLLLLPANPEAHGPLVTNLKLYGGVLAVLAVLGLGTFLALAAQRSAARGVFVRLAALGPPPARDRAVALFDGFVEGLESVRSPRALLEAAALSLVHWLNGSISIYLLFHAFSIALPVAAACFTTVAIALTVALPQAPGFSGVFHKAVETTLVLWGEPGGPAKAFGIVFWAVSFLPVTTTGVLFAWREGLRVRDFASGRVEPPQRSAG